MSPPRNFLVLSCSETCTASEVIELLKIGFTDLLLWLTYCMKKSFLLLGCKHVRGRGEGGGGGGSAPPPPRLQWCRIGKAGGGNATACQLAMYSNCS